MKRNLRKARAPRRVRVVKYPRRKKSPATRVMKSLGSRIGRSLNPNPGMVLKRHHYHDIIPLTPPTAGVAQKYTFRANDMYDPDYTATGHQPMYRDDYALHYKNYTVMNSSIRWNIAPNTDQPAVFKAYMDDAAAGTAQTLNEFIEQRGMSNLCIPSDSNGGKWQTLTNKYAADKWNKTSFKGIMADDTYNTAVGSTPTNVVYFNFYRIPLTNAYALDDAWLSVQITYLVLWRDSTLGNTS